ncbi:MAG TPA: DUF2243 domain-containing protein [Ramlibacter sp.]
MRAERRHLIAAALLLGAGMGGFVDGIVFHQLLEWHNIGAIDHLVLGIHRVNEYAADPLWADLAFLASGIALSLAGWAFIRAARNAPAVRPAR